MSQFHYRAARYEGDIVQGVINADDQAAALALLQAQRLVPIAVEPVGRRAKSAPGLRLASRQIGHRQLTTVTQQLAGLLQAGLPLDRALTLLIGVTDEVRLRSALEGVQGAVRGGASLADALAQQQGLFSPFYVNLVRAGEAGGALGEVLDHLASHLERAQWLRDVLISALIYPVVLCVVALASILLLLTFVVPQFEQLFADSGQLLPLPTRITLAGGRWVQHYYWLPPLVLLFAIPLWRALQHRSPELRYRWQRLQLRLPLWGALQAKVHTARWCQMLATLLGNGIALVPALKILLESQQSELMRRSVAELIERVSRGDRFAQAVERLPILPPLARQMIQVGDESGELVLMLEKLARWYDREVETHLKRLMAMLEPVLILVMGAVIAWVVISILLAMLSVNELAI